ncbi:MAG: hypothetical protein GEV10_26560 [Streptosporangiales bacterium]|nr:hypothetical protein [Streptosporangiales bacterium]
MERTGTGARGHVGIVTIGQSPRPDIAAVLATHLDATPLVQAGALDDLAPDAIRALAPVAGDAPLISRLRDGTEVVVGKRALMPCLTRAVAAVSPGARVVAVLCSGSFPDLAPTTCPTILPEQALHTHLAGRLGGTGRLGVLAPLTAQADTAPRKWRDVAGRVDATDASPYGPDDAVVDAARRLAATEPDVVLLDCMGFVERHRQLVADIVDAPVVTPSSVLGETLAGAVAR